jgi:hypothetical protein
MEDLAVIPLSNCRPISASSLAGSALTVSGLPEMPTPITCATCLLPGRRIRAIAAVGFW